MKQRLSYIGNVLLVVACLGLLWYHNQRIASETREAKELSRRLAEWEAKSKAELAARDEEFRQRQAASQARIKILEAEAAELSAREFFHQRVGALGQADQRKQGWEARGEGGLVVVLSIQTEGGGEGLGDGELAVGDAELRGEGDLAQERLAVGGGRPA